MWPSSVPSGSSAAQPRPHTSSPSSEPCHENSTPGLPSRSASRQSSFSRHHDETQLAEAGFIELDEAGLDQINGLLIPVVHLGDTPPANDARALGHATRVAARKAGSRSVGPHFDKKVAKAEALRRTARR